LQLEKISLAQHFCAILSESDLQPSLRHQNIREVKNRMITTRCLLILLFCLAASTVNGTTLQLSQEEQAWLKEHKTIRISGPQAFPPFQYVDNDGIFKGMASDYIFFIAQMVGLKIEVAQESNWPEILEKVKNKEIDVLTCAAITPERSNYLLYTKPHLTFPLVIVSRKDAPFIGGLDSLYKKRIALANKTSTIEWLQRDKIDVIPHFATSPLDALKAVSLGQADVAIENLAAATYLMEKNGLTNLKIAAPTSYENYALSIAVRNDWPELANIFDKGLAAISQEKHNEIRQRWIAVRYEHGISVQEIVNWLLIGGSITLILITIFWLWNRKLAGEIQVRKATEREKEKLILELTGALNEIKTLRGILPICSKCKSIRDDKGYWTQIESYISRHSDADFSHSICPNCIEKIYGKEDWFKKGKFG
jgi:ABC-type amino acid transport substrate-binding protein